MASLKEILSWFEENKYPIQKQFKESWTSLWHKSEKKPMEQIEGLSAPDDSDLTLPDGLILFKDRKTNDSHITRGYVFLRTNEINGVNIITEDMLISPNCTYVIRYDYDLNGESLKLPPNITLLFEGGSIKNGTIIADSTTFKLDELNCLIMVHLNGSYTFEDNISGYIKYSRFGTKTIINTPKQAVLANDGYYYVLNRAETFQIDENTQPNESDWSCVGLLNGTLVNSSDNYNIKEVQSHSDYNPQIALQNTISLNKMLRCKYFDKFFVIGKGGLIYCIGSILPYRDNITIEISSSAQLIGRYSDSSVDMSSVEQYGEFIGIHHKGIPGLPVERTIQNVTLIINGDISTEFNEGHMAPHNNNVIGIGNSNDCRIIGSGGISGSDHRGINYDYRSSNIYIDIEYIQNTYSNAVSCKGGSLKSQSSANVSINKIINCNQLRSDTNALIIASGHDCFNLKVGSIVRGEYNIDAHVLFCVDINHIQISLSSVDNYHHVVRVGNKCNSINVVGGRYYHVSSMIVLTALVESLLKIKVKDLEYVSGNLDSVVHNLKKDDTPIDSLIIANCYLAKSGYKGFTYYRGPLNVRNINIYDNVSPKGYRPNILLMNKQSVMSLNYAEKPSNFIQLYFMDPDYSYQYVTISVHIAEVNLSKTVLFESLINADSRLDMGHSCYVYVSNNYSSGSTLISFRTSHSESLIHFLKLHN